MLIPLTILAVVLASHPARAGSSSCPTPTVPGGGPAATDCIVQWGGVPGLVVTCVDGEACDQDGAADGACTFGLQAFANVAPCTPGPLTVSVKPGSSPVAQALTTALGTVAGGTGCTTPGLSVPLRVALSGIKPGVAKLTVTARAGGKPDKDKLRLTCQPSATPPPFAAVQAIFTAKCATAGCHDAITRSQGLALQTGAAVASLVGVPSTEVGKFPLVQAGSIKRSYLARKVLGQGLPASNPTRMPTGQLPLPDAELFTILSWIANGAPAS
jgi:hypothetical protein